VGRTTARTLLVGCATALLATAVLASEFGDLGGADTTSADAGLTEGLIYSTDDGDPIDVFYGPDESGMECMTLSGFLYSGNVIFADGRT